MTQWSFNRVSQIDVCNVPVSTSRWSFDPRSCGRIYWQDIIDKPTLFPYDFNVQDTANIDLVFNTVTSTLTADLIVTGVVAGGYGTTTKIPEITVDVYGRILDIIELDVQFPVKAVGDTADIDLSLVGTVVSGILTTTGVSAGTYGSASAVPVITVDAKGRVTALTTATISNVYWALNGNMVGSEKWIGTVDNFQLPVRIFSNEVARFGALGLGIGGVPVSMLTIPVAPTATANYGSVSIGSGGFAGAVNNFAGSAGGTHIAVNAASAYTGDVFNYQLAGANKLKIDYTGLLTIQMDGLATTATDGVFLKNTTAATALVPRQTSPSIHFMGNVWDTTTASSKQNDVRVSLVQKSSTTNQVEARLNIEISQNGGAYSGVAYFYRKQGFLTDIIGLVINRIESSNQLMEIVLNQKATLVGGLTTTGAVFAFSNANSRIGTSGESNFLDITETFAPTSGTGTYNGFRIINTIEQSGGASGIARSLYITPVVIAAADFRAIEVTVGNVMFGTTSGLMSIGISTAVTLTARLNLAACTTLIAPLKLVTGTLLAGALEGSVEFVNPFLYFTPNSTDRRPVVLAGRNEQSGTSYTVLNTDIGKVVGLTNVAARAITLPAVANVPAGYPVWIKDEAGTGAGANVTVSPAAGNIDGAATYVMNTNYQLNGFYHNGTNWFVI